MGQHLERKNEGGLWQYIEIELKKLNVFNEAFENEYLFIY